MQLPHTITLKKPVQHGSAEISQLVFEREIQAGDLFDINLSSGLTGRDFANIIARLTGQPLPVISRLGFSDFSAAMEFVNSFLSDGQPTGTAA
ncbi:phage tail assembly protein [Deltaproteobacteria bacterium OttesenSCG-928-M10]|nr:phage tail assembly protein [Deltaproteobacteria bacterium OttesenSCG-928-M10]